jgi:hypothetical protein
VYVHLYIWWYQSYFISAFRCVVVIVTFSGSLGTDSKQQGSRQVAKFSTCTQYWFMEMITQEQTQQQQNFTMFKAPQKETGVTWKYYIFSIFKTARYMCYSLLLAILRPGMKTHILACDHILGLFESKTSPSFTILIDIRNTRTERHSCHKLFILMNLPWK